MERLMNVGDRTSGEVRPGVGKSLVEEPRPWVVPCFQLIPETFN